MRILILFLSLALLAGRAAELEAPPGYTVREFGPLGGALFVPDGWHYSEPNGPNGGTYIVAKEHNPGGSYDTGMRIQFIAGVKKSIGLTAGQAVEMNIKLKKEHEKPVRQCDPEDLGLFKRVCLETTGFPVASKPKQEYHMVYSFWWNDDMDLMIGSTFGAPVETWKEANAIYGIIGRIKFADGSRMAQIAADKKTVPPTKAEPPPPTAKASDAKRPAAPPPTDPALDKIAELGAIQFINRDEDLQWRLGTDVQPLVNFINLVRAAVAESLSADGIKTGGVANVMIGIPAKGRLRIWLTTGWDPLMPTEKQRALIAKLEALTPPPVKNGPIAFNVTLALNGATAEPVDPSKLRLPQEWSDVLHGKSVPIPDGLPESIWAEPPPPAKP